MINETISGEKTQLSTIIKKAGDEDVSEWLRQGKQVLDTFASSSGEAYRSHIEQAYENLRKIIENASGFDKNQTNT